MCSSQVTGGEGEDLRHPGLIIDQQYQVHEESRVRSSQVEAVSMTSYSSALY